MAEYIEREALLEKISRMIDYCEKDKSVNGLTALFQVCDAIIDCKAADVVEVRHGRWEQVKSWSTKAKYRCSVCGREIMSATKVNIEKYPYCHCGAKMEVKE